MDLKRIAGCTALVMTLAVGVAGAAREEQDPRNLSKSL